MTDRLDGPWCATDNKPLAECEKHRLALDKHGEVHLTGDPSTSLCDHGVSTRTLCVECAI